MIIQALKKDLIEHEDMDTGEKFGRICKDGLIFTLMSRHNTNIPCKDGLIFTLMSRHGNNTPGAAPA